MDSKPEYESEDPTPELSKDPEDQRDSVSGGKELGDAPQGTTPRYKGPELKLELKQRKRSKHNN
jgi:hypothetical protein